jgi:hypothetical protein
MVKLPFSMPENRIVDKNWERKILPEEITITN